MKKNSLNLLAGLSYNERKATLKYSGTKIVDGISSSHVNGVKKIIYQYPCLDIKLSSIANLKKKYGIYNAIGFRTNEIGSFHEHYLTYSSGFLFYLKKINIMLSMDYLIFNPKSNTHYVHSDIYSFRREYYNLINFFGISIFFNKPLKNKKNEEK